jgi:hypothetical protein
MEAGVWRQASTARQMTRGVDEPIATAGGTGASVERRGPPCIEKERARAVIGTPERQARLQELKGTFRRTR